MLDRYRTTGARWIEKQGYEERAEQLRRGRHSWKDLENAKIPGLQEPAKKTREELPTNRTVQVELKQEVDRESLVPLRR